MPKILKIIPRASRPLAASKLACILDGVTAKNDLVSWDHLFRFPSHCLCTPVRGGHRKSLVSVVNQQLREEVDPPSTQQGSLIGVRPNPNVKSKHKSDPLSSLATCVASKLEECDYRGAVRLACSDDTIAVMNAETVAALQAKHPLHIPTSLLQWNMPPPHLSVGGGYSSRHPFLSKQIGWRPRRTSSSAFKGFDWCFGGRREKGVSSGPHILHQPGIGGQDSTHSVSNLFWGFSHSPKQERGRCSAYSSRPFPPTAGRQVLGQ